MQAVKEGHAVRRAFWGVKVQDCYLLDAKAMAATDWIIADELCPSLETAAALMSKTQECTVARCPQYPDCRCGTDPL
jgi:hypothetical protein